MEIKYHSVFSKESPFPSDKLSYKKTAPRFYFETCSAQNYFIKSLPSKGAPIDRALIVIG